MTLAADDPRNYDNLTDWCDHIAATHYETDTDGMCYCGYEFGGCQEDHIAQLCSQWTPPEPPPAPVVFQPQTRRVWALFEEYDYSGRSETTLYANLTDAMIAVEEDAVQTNLSPLAIPELHRMLPLPWQHYRNRAGDIVSVVLRHGDTTTTIECCFIH